MAIIQNSRWLFVAAALLVVLASIWMVRGSGSDNPARAASAATQSLGAESSWIEFDGILGQKTNLGHSAWSDAFSVRVASKLVPPETRWSATRLGGNVTLDATSVTKAIDGSTPSPMNAGLDARPGGSVSPDVQIQLASPSNQSDGKSITVPMTATVVQAVPVDSGNGKPTP